RTLFKWMNGRPAVWTSMGWMILDSGSAQLILFGVVSGNKTQGLSTLSGFQETGVVSNKTLRIDGRTVWRGEALAVPPQQAETGVWGLLPLNLFKSIYVCNSENYVVLY